MSSPKTAPQVMLGLAFGVAAVSTSAVLIRLAAAPALTVTAWRLSGGGLFYILVHALRTRSLPSTGLQPAELKLAALSALALALHFLTWIASLDYSSVVSSVVLVTTAPVWVALGSVLLLGERPGRRTWTGVLVAMGGALVITFADRGSGAGSGPSPLLGDLLALAGALCFAAYYLIGRRLRRDLTTVRYVALVYGGAALLSLVTVAFTRTPMMGFAPETYLYLGLIILLPQIVGHTTYNWALGHISATLASVAGLMEPVGAGILAWFVLAEAPGPVQAAGAITVLVGVWLAARGETLNRPAGPRAGRG